MPHSKTLVRATSFDEFQTIRQAGNTPFFPQNLAHIYIKLDFKPEFENAGTAENAKKFLRSVSRAATAAQLLAQEHQGQLLEVQGSMLHVTLSPSDEEIMSYVADLHQVYGIIFSKPGFRVDGWRMTVDVGQTLIVSARDVHGDMSYVSLGKAANRPAKYLYCQLEVSEDRRDLKRFFVGVRSPEKGRWHVCPLAGLREGIQKRVNGIAETVRSTEPNLDFTHVIKSRDMITASAAPIAPAGSPGTPTPEEPHTNFGWVMRADLDGFTQRVEDCLDKAEELLELAGEFYSIMDIAATFVEQHNETLAQLPWAGDNFTAAAVFKSKAEYEDAIPTRLVELALDFDKEMQAAASSGGFGGWAYGIAGGEVHGNANGNVYIAGIEIAGTRYLVGAGEGFGRSTQAFSDINPKPNHVIAYFPDYVKLEDEYQDKFSSCLNTRNSESTLYRSSDIEDLNEVRGDKATKTKVVSYTPSIGESRSIVVRPHCR